MPPRGGPTTISLQQLLPKRLNEQQISKVATALLEGTAQGATSRPRYVKGVNRGRFFRIKLKDPPTKSSPSHLPALPQPGGPFPHGFKSVHLQHHPPVKPTTKKKTAKTSASSSSQEEPYTLRDYWILVQEWMKENWSTVVLNLGSVATLIGFTRSDVLELRMLSVTGSTANVIYHLTLSPTRYLPVCWSALFATVNGFKIREILQERHSKVQMTPEQEDIYIQSFLPHGITPRQFQVLEATAEKVVIPKGEAIIRQGEVMEHVCLVVSGSTRASISGRRLTAASAICPKSITEEKAGGNSGAWIGEQNFLEVYWNKEQKKKRINQQKKKPAAKKPTTTETKSNESKGGEPVKATSEGVAAPAITKESESPNEATTKKVSKSNDDVAALNVVNRYTIVAMDECIIWRWKFEEIESMMNRSTDFRAALSRAMTSAIVSKVVNFTVGKTAALPTWSTWLDDWRYNAGAKVTVKTDDDDLPPLEEDSEEEDDSSKNDTDEAPYLA